MRRFYTLLIVFVWVLCAFAQKREVRAVWVATIGGIDWPRSYAQSPASAEKQKKDLVDMLDKLQAAGINTVLFQTRVRATTVYPSRHEPWDGCITGTPGKAPCYDPLRFAIEECHKRGMELHAWLVTIPVGKWNGLGCKTLRKRYPSLVKRIGAEGYMNPENPRTASYLAAMSQEIVRQYDVDGIHLDYIRYPEQWRVRGSADRARGHITAIVRAIHQAVKSEKPWVKMSCSPIGKFADLSRYKSGGWNAYARVFQDARAWLKEGLMDELYPMMYFRGDQFYPFAIDWQEQSQGRMVAPGLGIYFLHPSEGKWRIEDITREMYHLRYLGQGYAFFRAKFFIDNTQGIYDFTSKVFNSGLSLVPAMTWQDSIPPASPKDLSVTRASDATIVSWQPADAASADSASPLYTYYNVYASRQYPVDIEDAAHLIAIRRRGNSLRLNHAPEGFFYAVTAMDRYGNESEPLQMAAPPSFTMPQGFLECDGKQLSLPPRDKALDADMLFVETLQGRAVAKFPYRGEKADVTNLPNGVYQLRAVDDKGVTHRLGFFAVRRD